MENKSTSNLKSIFLKKFEPEIANGSIKKICDLGSGLSLNFLDILKKYPQLRYVGIEPYPIHVERARQLFKRFKNVEIFCADGYSPVNSEWGTFDLVISLSVLEHVKQLDKFIINSAAAARSGGQVVHRWDLGHALYPSSLKEKFQIWMGDHLPALLPENKFVRTLMPSEVRKLMSAAGIEIERETYHQMRSHKDLLRIFSPQNSDAEQCVEEIVDWEFHISRHLDGIEEQKRLMLFPSVAIWGRKK